MKDIQRINNKDRLDNYLYIISKDNQKLKKELIEKNLLENGFIEKKVADIELRKVELLEKGLIDEKEFLKKATTFKPKKKKVKGINFKIIYTPMGNKR